MTIFDRIIAGQLPASFAYQDDICVAFMDIHPITRGHVLVVPRRSVATLAELDADVRRHMWETAHRISLAQQRALGSVAQHYLINDGKGASQTVPHVHIHVVPRYGRDMLHTLSRLLWHVTTLTLPHRPETAEQRAKFEALAGLIRKQMRE